jgi:hypothetical protein
VSECLFGGNETRRRKAPDVARRRRFFAQLEPMTAVDSPVNQNIDHWGDAAMKHCPKCRMESRSDADWCWHCGYSYEDAKAGEPPPSGALNDQSEPGDRGEESAH